MLTNGEDDQQNSLMKLMILMVMIMIMMTMLVQMMIIMFQSGLKQKQRIEQVMLKTMIMMM